MEWNGDKINATLGGMSPMLMAMGQNMMAAPNQRDPQAMQQGLALMMQQAEKRKKQEAYQQILGGQQSPGATPGFNPDGGLAAQMGVDPRILAAMDPEQGMGLLAQIMAQRAQPPELTEFDRLSQGMSPEQIERARQIKLGLAPKAEAPNARQPASVQEYEYARQNGFAGSYDEFLGRKNPGTTVNVGGPNPDKFRERSGTILADEAAAIAQSGASAMGNLRAVDRLGELLEASPSGGFAAFQQFLGEFGIQTRGLDNIQAAQALINKLVPEQRPPGSGPMSDADLALFKQSLPRIINTPDGNAKILETIRGIAAYDVQRGQIARKLQLGEITPSEADAAWNALSNPLADFAKGNRGPGTPIGGFDKIPQGVDPSDWEFMSPEDRALFE